MEEKLTKYFQLPFLKLRADYVNTKTFKIDQLTTNNKSKTSIILKSRKEILDKNTNFKRKEMILMIKHFGQVYVDQTLKQNPKKKKKTCK